MAPVPLNTHTTWGRETRPQAWGSGVRGAVSYSLWDPDSWWPVVPARARAPSDGCGPRACCLCPQHPPSCWGGVDQSSFDPPGPPEVDRLRPLSLATCVETAMGACLYVGGVLEKVRGSRVGALPTCLSAGQSPALPLPVHLAQLGSLRCLHVPVLRFLLCCVDAPGMLAQELPLGAPGVSCAHV